MVLIVGDPHVKQDNLDESKRLMEFIVSTAKANGVNEIWVLGDLFHTHGIIRMDVQSFWMSWAKTLGATAPTTLLVGNHDQKGDDQSEGRMSALDSLKWAPGVRVVDSPTVLGKATFLPHTHDAKRFAHWVSEANTSILVVHQTFNGASYENGFYAKDGLDPKLVEGFDVVISGHIHKTQNIANIFYPGTARWDSISDANESKGIWLFNPENLEVKMVPTDTVCTPIVSVEVKEGDALPEIREGSKTHISLVGSSTWIAATAKKLKGKVRLSAKPTDTKFAANGQKLSSLEEYSNSFKFSSGILKDDVLKFLKDL